MNQSDLNHSQQNRTLVYLGWVAKRAALLLFDVGVSYLAYFIALVIRFFANGRFLMEAGKYLQTFYRYAPYHALLTVLVFIVAGLYTSRWKYAGINDLTRIVASCLLLGVSHYLGTKLFLMRMPLSYYFLGAFFQFLCTIASRFSYYTLQGILNQQRSSRTGTFNLMIVGVGDTANYITRHIQARESGLNRVACYFSWGTNLPNGKINGVPVVSGMEQFSAALKKYDIHCVCLGDPELPSDLRQQLCGICAENHLGVEDYADLLQFNTGDLIFSRLMKITEAPVSVRLQDETRDFPSGAEAASVLPGSYVVRSVSTSGGRLHVSIVPRGDTRNDLSTEWVKQTEQQTGEPISFF